MTFMSIMSQFFNWPSVCSCAWSLWNKRKWYCEEEPFVLEMSPGTDCCFCRSHRCYISVKSATCWSLMKMQVTSLLFFTFNFHLQSGFNGPSCPVMAVCCFLICCGFEWCCANRMKVEELRVLLRQSRVCYFCNFLHFILIYRSQNPL